MLDKNIKVGDYVLATRWSDRDWNDPWAIGFVTEIENQALLKLGKKDGSLIDSYNCYRRWSNAIVVTPEQAAVIIELYNRQEGTEFDPDVLAPILGIPIEPFPCPVCGSIPRVEPIDPEREGGAWANVTCSGTQELGTGHYINICSGIYNDDRANCQEHKQSAIARWNEAFGDKHE